MRTGNVILLVVFFWFFLLLSGCSTPRKQPHASAAPGTENSALRNSTPARGPLPPHWIQIKPGISKEEFHAILGPAWLHHEDKTSLGLAQELIKREGDFIYLMSVHFDQNERFKGGSFHTVPALLSSSYTPSSVPLKIPAAVVRETERQIQHYLGGIDRRGIPLLDTSIDWTDLRHWPDQLELAGKQFSIQVSKHDFHTSEIISSKAYLTQGRGAGLRYKRINSGEFGPYGPSAYWSETAQIKERGFSWKGKRVFLHAFYPNGHLRMFSRDDHLSGIYRSDYFDRSGRLIAASAAGDYRWRGKPISGDELRTRLDRLWGIKPIP